MENLNTILYILAAVLTLAEIVIRWGLPGFRKNPANINTVETIDSLWVAMIVALSLKAVLLQPFTIPSGSMKETLQIGDYILVKKYEYGFSLFNRTPRFLQFKKPQRGDILVFVYPKDHSKDFIKRCRALPGDVLEYKNKVLFVNGLKQDEPFAVHVDPHVDSPAEYFLGDPNRPLYGARDNFGPVTVEAGHYFMMGDNRDNSSDSRYWGLLDEKLIKGKAWVIYWHSVSLAHFISLAALAVAGVTAFWLAFAYGQKRFFGPKETTEEEAAAFKNALIWIGASLVVAAVVAVWSGFPAFQECLAGLKDRMFTVIR